MTTTTFFQHHDIDGSHRILFGGLTFAVSLGVVTAAGCLTGIPFVVGAVAFAITLLSAAALISGLQAFQQHDTTNTLHQSIASPPLTR